MILLLEQLLSAFFATLQMLLKTKTLPMKPITTQATPLPRTRLVLGLLGTAEQTSPPGGNETGLLTGGGLARDGRSLTNVLVVTTPVRVIHGVHGNTTSLGPGVALDGELVLRAASLQQGLVGPAATSDNADHATDGALDDLLGAGGELDAGLALIRVVADDGNVVTRGAAERATVAHLLLHVGDDGTLRDGAEGKDVADGEGGVLAGVDKLAGVHALVGDEGLGVQLVAVGIAELDLGQRCATAGVVDDLLNDTTDVSMALGEVEGAELRRRLVKPGVGSEDRAAALPLVANDTTHLDVFPGIVVFVIDVTDQT